MSEAYHLVNKVGMSYQDVKGLTKYERAFFLKSYLDEQEKILNEH